jgi:hypothetical protein
MPVLVTRRLVGVVGAVVSGAVVAVTGSLSAETLPDGSIACTRYVRVVNFQRYTGSIPVAVLGRRQDAEAEAHQVWARIAAAIASQSAR